MKKLLMAALLFGAATCSSLAQPPDGPGPQGPPGGPGGPGGPGRPGSPGPGMNRPSPEDFVNMAMRFDKDGDGKLDRDELMELARETQRFRMQVPPGGPQGGPPGLIQDARPEGGAPREARRPEGRRPEGGPPPEGRPRPEGRRPEGGPPPEGGPRPEGRRPEGGPPPEGGPRPEGRRPEGGPPPEGGPRPEGPRPEGGPPPEGRGTEGRGPGGFQPNPERFVDRAMQFDRDGDGKLSRDELMEFAKNMPFGGQRQQGPGGPPEGGQGRGRGQGGPGGGFGGLGGPGGGPGGPGGPGGSGGERPRRPDF
jgi:translation initiation factor IF-2